MQVTEWSGDSSDGVSVERGTFADTHPICYDHDLQAINQGATL